MKKEQIGDFTRRISQCNKGGLIVVMYDIFFTYAGDAKEALTAGDSEAYKNGLRGAQRTLDELIDALDFSYDLAGELYSIYVFCRNLLAKAMYKRTQEEICQAVHLMQNLYDAFCQVAEADTSAPLMQNAQQVYAGYTYGRDELVETCRNMDTKRGFLV